MNNSTHCAGCGQSFASYNMTPSEGYTQDGYTYCNADCQMESENALREQQEWEDLGQDY